MVKTVYAIPSYKRSDKIGKLTLGALKAYGIAPGDVYVFLSNAQEKKDYEAALCQDKWCPHLVVAKQTLKEKRNFVLQYFPAGTHIVMMDDDIRSFHQLTPDGKKLEPLRSMKALVARGFALAQKHGAELWGVYPTPNPFWMKQEYSTDLKFIIGTFFGLINPRGGIKGQLDDKDDYERTLMFWERDGVVIRLNNVSMRYAFYTMPGGLSDPDRVKKQQHAVEQLIKRWPQYVRRNPKRKGDYPEVLLARTSERLPAN